MPKKPNKDDGGRVVLPNTTVHPETNQAIRAIQQERRVALGVAIDELYWELKRLREREAVAA